MADIGTLIMKIKADASHFNKGMASVKNSASNIGKSVGNVAKTVGVASVAITGSLAAIGTKATLMGAEAEEMRNKYNVVFSGMTDEVDAWAKEYSKRVGRSKYDTQEFLSNLADLQQGLGMTTEESFNLSKKIVELGTDLASFNNLQDEQAIEAISKAMLGEAESAKQLGLLLNVDRVKAYAESLGLVYKELSDGEKANLVYELAVKQSQNAIGDAERSSESFTNQVKALKTSIKDTATDLGLQLIPMATKLVNRVNENVVPALGSFVEKAVEVGTEVATYMQPKISTLVDFISRNMPTIKAVAETAFNGIKTVAENLGVFFENEMLPIFDRLKSWWDDNGENVKQMATDVFDGIKLVAKNVWDYFSNTLLPIFGDLVAHIANEWPGMKDNAIKALNGIKGAVEPLAKMVAEDLLKGFKDLVEYLGSSQFTSDIETAVGVLNQLVEPIRFIYENFRNVKAEPKSAEEFEEIYGGKPKYMEDPLLKGAVDFFDQMLPDSNPGSDRGGAFPYPMPTPKATPYGNFRQDEELYMPTGMKNTSGNNVTVNVTGNTIMNERDARKIGNMITDALKREGVYAS